MKNLLLLPRYFRIIGLILLPLSVVLLLATMNDFSFHFLDIPRPVHSVAVADFNDYNLTNEFAMAGIAIGLFMIGFSRLRHEDEYLQRIRLQSLHISIYVYLLLLLFAVFAINGLSFFIMMGFNAATVLVVFNILFFTRLYIRPLFTRKLNTV